MPEWLDTFVKLAVLVVGLPTVGIQLYKTYIERRHSRRKLIKEDLELYSMLSALDNKNDERLANIKQAIYDNLDIYRRLNEDRRSAIRTWGLWYIISLPLTLVLNWGNSYTMALAIALNTIVCGLAAYHIYKHGISPQKTSQVPSAYVVLSKKRPFVSYSQKYTIVNYSRIGINTKLDNMRLSLIDLLVEADPKRQSSLGDNSGDDAHE